MDQAEILKALKASADALAAMQGEVKSAKDGQTELRRQILELAQKGVTAPIGSPGMSTGGVQELADVLMKSAGAEAFMKGGTPSFSVEVPARLLGVKNTLINATGQNQPLVQSDRADSRGIVTAPRQRLTIRGLFAAVPTNSNMIERPAEATFTNNAAPQGDASPGGVEGERKAESHMTFTLLQTPVVTLAHWIPASRQILGDAPLLLNHLENALLWGLNKEEEDQLLTGNGTAGNMSGIIANAAAFTGGATNATRLDTLARAATQLAVSSYEPSSIIMHPSDWLACQLEKNAQGDYVLGDPGATRAPFVWGLPVVPTPSMTQGKFVCLDAARYGYIADRETANVRIGEKDDQFVRNLVTVLCEKRCTLVTELGAAAVYGDLTYAG